MTTKNRPTIPPTILPLLIYAVKTHGINHPNETLSLIEEQLTVQQYDNCLHFLVWVKEDPLNRSFGHANIQERVQQWASSTKE